MKVKLTLTLGLLLAAQESAASVRPPPAQHAPAEELIARTQNIVLAKVVRADAASNYWNVLYTFKTIKRIKGRARDAFQILGRPAIWETSNERFDEHFRQEFWNEYAGRSSPGTSCRIQPEFAVGGTYLVFLDKPYLHKSFEMILITDGSPDKKDNWLQYVEKRTGP